MPCHDGRYVFIPKNQERWSYLTKNKQHINILRDPHVSSTEVISFSTRHDSGLCSKTAPSEFLDT